MKSRKNVRKNGCVHGASGAGECNFEKQEAVQRISTDTVILVAGVCMTLYSGLLASNGVIITGNAIICIIAMMSSFGPTAALSALSNNLNQTLASGNRVLNLLAEEPVVMDVESNVGVPDEDIRISNVTFTYPEDKKKRNQF